VPPTASPARFLIDDRLLIEELLVGLHLDADELWTTAYWYYRACRAATLGSAGHLSGPFQRLPHDRHATAVLSLLELPETIHIADARRVVPVMARISGRHPQLNLLNLEATAAATVLSATVRLSSAAAKGILPTILDAEGLSWTALPLHNE
jgi:hypothetical protein